MPRRLATAAGLLAVLATTACAPGDSAPESSAPSTPLPASEPATPPVENPKNLGAITDACRLLTPEQLVALSAGTEAEPDTTEYGESKCTWRNDDFRMTVALNTTTSTGPVKIQEDGKASDNFAPTEVDGYPAARVDAQSNLCRVEVGVAETESFAVNYSKRGGEAPEMQDPCGYAEKIAGEVLENIPAA